MDEAGLQHQAANTAPLTPVGFLKRAAAVYPQKLAVVHGGQRFTYAQFHERACRLASALTRRGLKRGDCVAIMSPNTPPMLEAHYGVPMMGGVLNSLNIRLDARTLAFILDHGEAKVLITDRECSPVIREALALTSARPLVVDIDDPIAEGGELLGRLDYEALLAEGDPADSFDEPRDEWQSISLLYTSGTTGNPKGVVYHHRGAYLNAIGNMQVWGMGPHPVYLWTLPMFHCNGWCFPWTVTALAGTHVCLRQVRAGAIYDAIADHGVTHLCGAPIVMQLLLGAAPEERRDFDHKVKFMTAAAPPPAAVLAAMQDAGIAVTHVYGLTEVYGPVVVCAWHSEWDDLDIEDQAAMKARQGVNYPVLEGLMVADAETLEPVPCDGKTLGEVFMRGNVVMKGYLKNPQATEQAFSGGWFHTGDLAVRHPDGYIELKDRSKDIIISGGENISSIEIEDTLYRHPAVAGVAVVARPDAKWGETPCAFVELKPGTQADEAGLIAFCRDRLAHFKAPRKVIFGPLPKTSTGKIQKFVLREQAKGL
ncbi:MAG: AMP-binding protein [Kiloniellaceae bacterium]|nr:AMP-binding protein [Kiloniellaceae bacterium]